MSAATLVKAEVKVEVEVSPAVLEVLALCVAPDPRVEVDPDEADFQEPAALPANHPAKAGWTDDF